jgi:beta-glucosidase
MDHTGDIACDQYHLYREDVALMKELGVKAYRCSIAWPRVFPGGTGTVNEEGIAYYDRLIDELLTNDIEPWVTMFHWDLPQAIQDRYGGWESRDIAAHFGDYCAFVTTRLSDRVKNFMTINEFMCFTDAGYREGRFPPGKRLTTQACNQVRHNALLAHGLGVQAIRDSAQGPVNVGLAENSAICVPVMETEDHIEASRTAMRLINAHFLTAVLEGAYAAEYLDQEGANAPSFSDEDMAIIGAPLDFIGLNMYAPRIVKASPDAPHGFEVCTHPESYPRLNMDWLYIGPQITYWGPRHLADIWGVKSVYITENGCACKDKLTMDNEVWDTDRVMYLRSHFISAHRAVSEGYPLRGYFVWSLLDNFEWAFGYTRRFGIVYVNFETLERIPKLSARFYQEVIERNAVV